MPSLHAVELYAKQTTCCNALWFLIISVADVAFHMDHENAFAAWHWTAALTKQRWQKPCDVRGVLVNCALFYCSAADASSIAVRPNCMAACCFPFSGGDRHFTLDEFCQYSALTQRSDAGLALFTPLVDAV